MLILHTLLVERMYFLVEEDQRERHPQQTPEPQEVEIHEQAVRGVHNPPVKPVLLKDRPDSRENLFHLYSPLRNQ